MARITARSGPRVRRTSVVAAPLLALLVLAAACSGAGSNRPDGELATTSGPATTASTTVATVDVTIELSIVAHERDAHDDYDGLYGGVDGPACTGRGGPGRFATLVPGAEVQILDVHDEVRATATLGEPVEVDDGTVAGLLRCSWRIVVDGVVDEPHLALEVGGVHLHSFSARPDPVMQVVI